MLSQLGRLRVSRAVAAVGIATIVGAIVIGAVARSSLRGGDEPPVKPAAALTVTGAVAKSRQWARTLKASGPVAAWQEAIVGAEISGQRLVELRVNVGDAVAKGEVLARFNTQTLRAQEAELAAMLEQAKATQAQAESDRARAVRLKAMQAMSEQQIAAAVTQENVAKAQTAAAQARLDAMRLQIVQATVVSPSDGVISSRTATLGAVGAAGGELFRLILDNRLEWRGALTARQLKHVAPGQLVRLTLPDDSVAMAKVRQTSPALDAQRMAIVYADIEPGGPAHVGMYADGAIALEETRAIVAPAASVVIRDGRSYVFKLLDGGNRVAQQDVVVGRRQGAEVEIVAGLEEGERVVALGAGFLDDGDIVRLAPQDAAAELAR
ncbi:MAG: efflux RND transporter periplasmic adaptor subunit [Methylocystaceae bacterium]|nr:MAG: efflux RND transporter periplasmic adaptor subunit [Methylocystaceae bacterium]